MNVYIVFVSFKVTGSNFSYTNCRYVDSQWASEEHAKARKKELEHSLEMGKVQEYLVQIKEGRISDASVTESQPKDLES